MAGSAPDQPLAQIKSVFLPILGGPLTVDWRSKIDFGSRLDSRAKDHRNDESDLLTHRNCILGTRPVEWRSSYVQARQREKDQSVANRDLKYFSGSFGKDNRFIFGNLQGRKTGSEVECSLAHQIKQVVTWLPYRSGFTELRFLARFNRLTRGCDQRAGVEDIHLLGSFKSLRQQDLERWFGVTVDSPNHGPCLFGQCSGVDRILGHQVTDEVFLTDAAKKICARKRLCKKVTSDCLPEWGESGFVGKAAQFCDHAFVKSLREATHEKKAAQRQQNSASGPPKLWSQ